MGYLFHNNNNNNTLNHLVFGAEQILKDIEDSVSQKHQTSYPPYNVMVNDDQTEYTIQIAVAGFSKNDITIEQDDRKLIIKGNNESSASDVKSFLHKGISNKKFTRTFSLYDHIEVEDVILENGLLTIELKKHIPDEQKPKQFKIK